MADRRVNLNIDSNVKDIKKTLDAIQKTLLAINKNFKDNVTTTKSQNNALKDQNSQLQKNLAALEKENRLAQERLNKERELSKLKAKAQGYQDFASSIKSGFSLDNLLSGWNKGVQNKIGSKYNGRRDSALSDFNEKIKERNAERDKELEGIKSNTKWSDTYKRLRSGQIAKKYEKLKGQDLQDLNAKNKELDEQEQGELAEQGVKAGKASVAVAAVQVALQNIKNIANVFNNLSKNMFGVSLSIKDAWGDILNYTKQTTDMYKGMATYATGSSLITNADARQTQMKYGLSSAQTYAFTQTSNLLNISDEDLMYMNQSQKQAFTQYMQKYSSWYEQLMSSGALQDIQQMQLEFAMFKQEIAVELLQFVAQNKDTLLAAAKGVVSILEWVMKLATKILGGVFGGGSSSTSNTANNVTVNVSYADGGAGGSQMDSFIGNLSRQISTAIGG